MGRVIINRSSRSIVMKRELELGSQSYSLSNLREVSVAHRLRFIVDLGNDKHMCYYYNSALFV